MKSSNNHDFGDPRFKIQAIEEWITDCPRKKLDFETAEEGIMLEWLA